MARNQFVDALKLFLDTADPGELENLALRLKPYRITSLQVQRPDGGPSARSIPVIVLDDGRKTPEPTPSLQRHIESITAVSQQISLPKAAPPSLSSPALTTPGDSFFDFTSLPWNSMNPACPTSPGNIELSIEDMILDDDQIAELTAEFSMPGTPGFHQALQDVGIPITPPYSDFFDPNNTPSTLSNDPYSPSTFLDSPITTPPSSDAGDFVNTPINSNFSNPAGDSTATSNTKSTNVSTPRAQAKINRRKSNPNRPRRSLTAASITQAILSSSTNLTNSHVPSPSQSPSPAAAALVFSSCIRKDYLDFLKANLPEWVRDGLWRSSSPLSNNHHTKAGREKPTCFMMMGNSTPTNHRPPSAVYSAHNSSGNLTPSGPSSSSSSTYGFLENIYSCVSQLDSRIETDQVRKRVALVLLHSEYLESYQDWKATRQGLSHTYPAPSTTGAGNTINIKGGVGRGDMTLMIDNILEQTTPGWEDLSPKRKLQLRALFHERKRYGKRWAVFREEVGCAILLVCSGQLGNMVSNTKVTMAALKGIAHAIRDSAPIMEVLRVLEPLAVALVNNDAYMQFRDDSGTHGRGQGGGGVEQMIRQFEELQARRGFDAGVGVGAEGCGTDDDEDME
ncbi:hypothetical protein QBC37DRAFT_390657 [Rhypophila decipiens]|uniref:Uncharacterized protein n=1 Tax=Rhypophila decipiens TaxID=261697 RepID=A0AAN6Y0B0_9PEZI|nr:hypothetical protein QBC37DRAFT_390657 [Rhypophila decipiens]